MATAIARQRSRHSRHAATAAWSVVLWSIAFIVASPLIWAVLSSLKSDIEVQRYPPTVLPQHVTLANYTDLFHVLPFGTFFLNTLGVAVATALLTIALASTAAYAMARFRLPVSEWASFVGLAAYMVPGILVVVPVFRVAHSLHALDSLPALTALYTAYFLPFGVWQLRSYFAGIPFDLEAAAMVDGATRFEAFYLVVLPQALPGLIATGIFTFAVTWNEFLFASLLLYTPAHQTLSAGLTTALIGETNLYSWGVLMAGATLMTLPVMVVFMVVQRSLVSGFGSGAVKG